MIARTLAFAALVFSSAATMLAAALACASPAQAHERWANGDPIPAWVKAECCGPADAHHLTSDQVHEVDGGFQVDGYDDKGVPRTIPAGKLLPSQDGDWWVFYRRYEDGTVSPVYCIFGVMGT